MRTYQGRLLEREDIWPKVWKVTRILLKKKVEEGTFDLKGCNIFDMVKARQVEWPKQRMMTGGSKIYWKVKFLMPEERNIILTLLKDNSFPCYWGMKKTALGRHSVWNISFPKKVCFLKDRIWHFWFDILRSQRELTNKQNFKACGQCHFMEDMGYWI